MSLVDETVTLDENKRREFSLLPGTYVLDVDTRPNGVIVTWGPECKHGNFKQLTTTCVLRAPTTLRIENVSVRRVASLTSAC